MENQTKCNGNSKDKFRSERKYSIFSIKCYSIGRMDSIMIYDGALSATEFLIQETGCGAL